MLPNPLPDICTHRLPRSHRCSRPSSVGSSSWESCPGPKTCPASRRVAYVPGRRPAQCPPPPEKTRQCLKFLWQLGLKWGKIRWTQSEVSSRGYEVLVVRHLPHTSTHVACCSSQIRSLTWSCGWFPESKTKSIISIDMYWLLCVCLSENGLFTNSLLGKFIGKVRFQTSGFKGSPFSKDQSPAEPTWRSPFGSWWRPVPDLDASKRSLQFLLGPEGSCWTSSLPSLRVQSDESPIWSWTQ